MFSQDSIEEINLEGNNISDVGPGLQSLQRVNLMNNVIKTLPRDSLKVSNFEGGDYNLRVNIKYDISNIISALK